MAVTTRLGASKKVKVGPEEGEPAEEPPELQADTKRAKASREVGGNKMRVNLLRLGRWAGMGKLLWCVGLGAEDNQRRRGRKYNTR
jgi:hypothetical protein